MDGLAVDRGVPPAFEDWMREVLWWPRGDRMAKMIDEVGEHPGDTVHVLGELLVAGGFEIAEIVGQEQEVIELTGGSPGNRQEPRQLDIAVATAPFGNVRRDRCGSTAQLVCQPVAFLLREGAGLSVDLQRQLVGSLPHPQIAKVPHLTPRNRTPTALGDRSMVGGQQYAANRHWPKTESHSTDDERPLAAGVQPGV